MAIVALGIVVWPATLSIVTMAYMAPMGLTRSAWPVAADQGSEECTSSADPTAPPSGQISFEQFLAVDIRVGTVVSVDPFPEARKPSWKLQDRLRPRRRRSQIERADRRSLPAGGSDRPPGGGRCQFPAAPDRPVHVGGADRWFPGRSRRSGAGRPRPARPQRGTLCSRLPPSPFAGRAFQPAPIRRTHRRPSPAPVGEAVVQPRANPGFAARAEREEEGEEVLVGWMVAPRGRRRIHRRQQPPAAAALTPSASQSVKSSTQRRSTVRSRRCEHRAQIVRDAARADQQHFRAGAAGRAPDRHGGATPRSWRGSIETMTSGMSASGKSSDSGTQAPWSIRPSGSSLASKPAAARSEANLVGQRRRSGGS